MKMATIGKTIFLPQDIDAGVKAIAARHGEAGAVVIRALLREGLARRGIVEQDIRAIEDARGIGGAPALPAGDESVRPIGRVDK